MLCVNLEGASLKGCNFEDPAGSRANMEGKLRCRICRTTSGITLADKQKGPF